MTPDEALRALAQPKDDLVAYGSQIQVLVAHGRSWPAAQEAAARAQPGEREPAHRLVAMIGDAPAPLLRHIAAEALALAGEEEAALVQLTRAAAVTPPWDPVLVAWAYNGLAWQLDRLGRRDDAARLIVRSWDHDPFYPRALETARTVGAAGPPAEPTPCGVADLPRLALAHAMLEDARPAATRATAMAMALLWSREHTAAASLAELATKLRGVDPTWPRAIAAHATARAKRDRGSLPALPKGAVSQRARAVAAARAAGNRALLEVAALDPEPTVMLSAWAALIELGHRREERVKLLRALIDASSGDTGKTMLAAQVEERLASLPTGPVLSAVELTLAAIDAVRTGAACALEATPDASTSGVQGLPPSLAAWLTAGSLPEPTPSTLAELARRAFGEAFAKLPKKLASTRALPLVLPETAAARLEVLLLEHTDAQGEAPVLALDHDERPTASLVAESFGAWLASDVGVTPRAPVDEALARAILGRKPTLTL